MSAVTSCYHCQTKLEGECISYTKGNQTTRLHKRCDEAWKQSFLARLPNSPAPRAIAERNIEPATCAEIAVIISVLTFSLLGGIFAAAVFAHA